MHLLEGKNAIVTGGSRGIGRAIAIDFARNGANVAISHWRAADTDVDRTDAIDEVVEEIEGLGQRCIAVEGDIALHETSNKLTKAAVDTFGSVDVLAANAGICPFRDFLDVSPKLLRQTIDVNLTGAYFVTQLAALQMKAQGTGGAIVATSSISALVGGGTQTHYTPTKAGVHSLMQSAAIALGPYNIRCNSVMPGTIETDLNQQDLSDPEKRAYFTGRIPLGRFGRPDDVAKCVSFLASDNAAYVTGAALLVDGGLYVNLQ